MNGMLKPTGALLVGIALLFLLFCNQPGIAQEPEKGSNSINSSAASLDSMKHQLSDPRHLFTQQEIRVMGISPFASSSGKNSAGDLESISMNAPGSKELDGLVSINTDKQRQLAFSGMLPSGDKNGASTNMNSMNIEVSKITVVAINLVEGGKAIATSDIILKPVQILGNPRDAEVQEKLG